MLQKFLLIGVGGSGGKTLRYVWRELDRRLNAAGWTGGMPAGWQFLHIDVPEMPDVVEGDVPTEVGQTHRYLGLAEAPQLYSHYDSALISRDGVLPALAGWRPDPQIEYSPVYLGAGQRRVVGRVVTITQLDRVRTAVRDGVRALMTGDATAQMQRVGRQLGADPAIQQPDPAVAVLISSMGGGSGSGAFLDVIEVLRTNAGQGAAWLDRTLMTFLYAADVFSDLDEERRGGVEPNSLAALAELLNAAEHEGPVPEIEQPLTALGRGNSPFQGRRSARHTFIVGNKNEDVTLESSLHVFRSVGKAIATFIVDDAVQHDFNSYLTANGTGRPCTREFLLAQNGRCSSLGFASVTLGRTLFADYASERLAKKSLDRLLRGYKEGFDDAHLRTDTAMIAQHVRDAQSTFFQASGLWELGGEHNQVLDALRDKAQFGGIITGVVDDVREALPTGLQLSPQQWKANIEREFQDRGRDFDATALPLLEKRAQEWTREVQQRVVAATARFVGLKGLDVTINLLVALNEQVLEASSELKRDRSRLLKEGSDALSSFRYLWDTLVDRVIGAGSDKLNSAVAHQRKSLQRRFEAGVCLLAADLLAEISTGLLANLQKALRNARNNLGTAEISRQYSELVSQWAVGAVPPHLAAAPNEVLLEEQSEVPARLERLFDALVEGVGWQAGESKAIEELISGAWPSRFLDVEGDGLQSLIETRGPWVPLTDQARPATESPRNAQFAMALSPATIERSAAKWVRERRGPISDHVGESLAQWLADDGPDSAARADTFADAVDRALAGSKPLVSVSPDVHTAVHGTLPPPPALIPSEIPIDSDHAAARRVIAALQHAGVDDNRARRLLNPNSDAREIGISSFGGGYVHPIVFDSVTGPINDQWRACTGQPQRDGFWGFRRSRRLPAFVPLSPSRQRALIRGWMTAEVLGYVGRLAGPWSEAPLSIWTPRGSRTFPRWLLGGDVADHGSLLPALMLSLPLAIVDYTGSVDDSLSAYFRLIQLGSSPAGVADASRPTHELERWIREGTTTDADPHFDAAPAPRVQNHTNAEERRDAVLQLFRAYAEGYHEYVRQHKPTPETTLTLGPAWEIAPVLAQAAEELIRSTSAIDAGGPDSAVPAIPLPR